MLKNPISTECIFVKDLYIIFNFRLDADPYKKLIIEKAKIMSLFFYDRKRKWYSTQKHTMEVIYCPFLLP